MNAFIKLPDGFLLGMKEKQNKMYLYTINLDSKSSYSNIKLNSNDDYFSNCWIFINENTLQIKGLKHDMDVFYFNRMPFDNKEEIEKNYIVGEYEIEKPLLIGKEKHISKKNSIFLRKSTTYFDRLFLNIPVELNDVLTQLLTIENLGDKI